MRTGKARTFLWLRGCTTPGVTELKTLLPVEIPSCGQRISAIKASSQAAGQFKKPRNISNVSNINRSKFIVKYLDSQKEGRLGHQKGSDEDYSPLRVKVSTIRGTSATHFTSRGIQRRALKSRGPSAAHFKSRGPSAAHY